MILTANLTRTDRALRSAHRTLMAATIAVSLAAIWLTVQMATYLSAPGTALGPETPIGWANRAHVLTCLLVFAAFGYAARKRAEPLQNRPGLG